MKSSVLKTRRTQYRLTQKSIHSLTLVGVTVLTFLLAACSGGDATGTSPAPTTPVGAYALTSVQGKALPYRLFSETNYSVDVADGSIAVTSDGNFVATMKSEERVENHLSVYSDTASGKWQLNGTVMVFTANDGSRTSGTWSGRNITLIDSSSATPVSFLYTMK